MVSVVIPNHNGGPTIGKCLEAAFSSAYENFEVVVVDDCSTDNSAEIIKKFPCRFIRLDKHSGASSARNAGARNSIGRILFFIDADCILQKETIGLAVNAASMHENTVIGGTYTKIPYDDKFFSAFQSIFINYSESKKPEPDYIASHAMIIEKKLFEKSGGFPESFLPIIEDVEFSHRLRGSGCKLVMHPEILVRHIFNYTLRKSLRNAFRKSLYWTIYSLKNRDLFKDSGTASSELKINVASYFLSIFFIMLFMVFRYETFLTAIPFITVFNLYINRRFLNSILVAKGGFFTVLSALYYILIYPFPVGFGSFTGMIKYFILRKGDS
ncbi:MAG: glycosyltransferase [Nitrospirota bacterium]